MEPKQSSIKDAGPSANWPSSLLSYYQNKLQVVTSAGRYLPDVQHPGWRLGKGGCFTTVERYYEEGTNKMFAIKKMPKKYRKTYDDLLGKELSALCVAQAVEVPRVIRVIGRSRCRPDNDCLILELVEGSNLSKHMPTEPQRTPAMETEMMQVASQLVDTLWEMHCVGKVCHMDLSPDNIMLLWDKSNPLDTLRVIDFGFARMINPGKYHAPVLTTTPVLPAHQAPRMTLLTSMIFVKSMLHPCHQHTWSAAFALQRAGGPQSLVVDTSIKDVKPIGTTAPYASPEVLRSLKLQFEGAKDDEEGVMINGCVADMWACACILYQMLTGVKPFLPEETEASTRQAPPGVPAHLQQQWLIYDAVAEAQRKWLEATQAVVDAPGTLRPPLLDRLGECSSNPDVAAEFFVLLFWPVPDGRLLHTALLHPYLKEFYANLQATAHKKDMPTSDEAVQQPEHVAEQPGSLEAPHQGRLAVPGAQSGVHEGAGQAQQAKQGGQPQVAQQAEQAQASQHDQHSRAVQLPPTGDPHSPSEGLERHIGGSALESGGEVCINHSDCKSESDHKSESHHSYESESDCESESEAESDATGDAMHTVLSSHSDPALISITPNGHTQADSIRSGTAMPASAGGVTAGARAIQGDSNRPSSGKCNPVQKLKKVLAKKLRPGCMHAADADITAPSHKQGKAMQGQKAANEQVVKGSSPAVDAEPESQGKRGAMRKVRARAGRCLQKVMPACMKPPPVHSLPHSQADVQPLTAVAGNIRKPLPTADEPGGQKKQLNRFTGLFKRKKAASHQALAGGPIGTLATQPVYEPSDFIAALRQPYDLARQADVPRAITTTAGKAAPLVGANDAIQPLSGVPSATVTHDMPIL
ncbi:Death-associated protein kinase 2 [Trebouxia sp. C0009 RCD-2024]